MKLRLRGLAAPPACAVILALAALAQGVPLVYQPLVPTAAAPGGPAFTLTADGCGFVSGAVVNWNHQPLQTQFVSSGRLTALVPAADIATAQTATVTVQNPGVSVASNYVYFQVANPITRIAYTEAAGSPVWMGAVGDSLNLGYSVAAGDFDGSGKLDLAIPADGSGPRPGFLDLFSGNGDGTFTLQSSTPGVGYGPGDIAVGDFTGNGRLDVATANVDSNTVSILLNNGDGTFSAAPGSPMQVGTDPGGIVAADFNHDGKLDLAVACQNGIYIFLGNGDGTFTPAPGSPITSTPYAFDLAVGDFNGDSNLDIAATNFGGNIFLLDGNGDGTFTPAPTLHFNPFYVGKDSAIQAADLNGDGNLDLAVAMSGNQEVYIFLGNGAGGFQQVATPVAGCCNNQAFDLVDALAMSVGDFLANGKLDLAVAEEDVNSGIGEDFVYVLLGNGDGTFTPSDYSTLLPEDPNGLATGDFDNNGLLDFAAVSEPTNDYSILMEPATPGPAPDFSLSIENAAGPVTGGSSAAFRLGVTSVNGFTGPVYLTCASGLPADATCSFSPYLSGPAGDFPSTAAGVIVPGPVGPEFNPNLTISTTFYQPATGAAAGGITTGSGPATAAPAALAAGVGLFLLLALVLAPRLRRAQPRWPALAAALLILGGWSCGAGPTPAKLSPQPATGTPPRHLYGRDPGDRLSGLPVGLLPYHAHHPDGPGVGQHGGAPAPEVSPRPAIPKLAPRKNWVACRAQRFTGG